MGSSSVGGGKSKAEGGASKIMDQVISTFFRETKELRNELQNQMLQALQTGGANAQIPLIGRAEEQQRTQTSVALRDIDAQLAKTGMAGTPFGERIRAEQIQAGRTALANVGPTISSQFIGQIPGYTQAAAQSISGALAGTRKTSAESKSYV